MTEGELLTDARNYVRNWAINKNIAGNEHSTLRLDYKRDVKMYNLHLKKKQVAVVEGESIKVKYIKKLPDKDLEDAFEEYMRELPIMKRSEVREAVLCKVEDLTLLKKWLVAVTGTSSETDLYVLAHWLWLVKRNLAELPVVYHIMPIIASPQKLGARKQGGGKSTAITKLIEPLKDVSTTLRMDQVSDDRNFTAFNNHLIGFLDEMAGSKKVEIEDFKRIVTAETLMYRPMRTNAQIQIKNLCSFIGASNNSIQDIIRDTTGTRRFFQLNALEQLDHDSINSINYLALWQGVDERKPRGYYEQVKTELVLLQDDSSTEDELEVFIDEHELYPITADITTVPVKKLYDSFVLYTRNRGHHFILQYQTFCHRLKNLGIQTTKKREGKKPKHLVAAVNAEHLLEGGKEDNVKSYKVL